MGVVMKMTDGKIVAVLLGALLVLAIMNVLSGCTGQPPGSGSEPGVVTAQPAVRVSHVEGTGAVGLAIDVPWIGIANIELRWAERGIEHDGRLLHCSVLEVATVAGLSIGSGSMPPPMSDEECALYVPPFRAAVAPAAPGAAVVHGATDAGGGGSADTSEDPSGPAVAPGN